VLLIVSYVYTSQPVTVIVPSYPTIPEAPLNHNLLDSLAGDYVDSLPLGCPPNSAQFTFVYLPIWAFTELNDFDLSTVNRSEILGILYIAGYFGGQWLRIRLPTRPANVPPAFTTISVRNNTNTGLAAVDGGGQTSLNYAFAQQNGSVDSFGYNSGYFRTILDHPPTGVPTNDHWEFENKTGDALSAKFETPQLSDPLQDYHSWYKRLNNKPIYNSLKTMYLSIQNTAYNRGVITWTGQLSVQGFSEDDYNLLLEASSGFLEIARLNSLAITQSVGKSDQNLAIDAALMYTNYLCFNGAYLVGLLNGANDNTSPFPFPSLVISY